MAKEKPTKKIDTESYKGVRDFYPEDMFVQNYIFNTWKKVAERFGYVEYGASILEPSDLYKAKSGDEIVNEQTYTFTDRGEREVTLRPEMTPTVARMVAQKQGALTFPLRWYSIPNLFRYEKPQRGRLREHWQLNVDLFGVDNSTADAEIITVAYSIMKEFNAKDSDFVIKVNSRKLVNDLYAFFKLNKDQGAKVSGILDKKEKISPKAFEDALKEVIGEKTPDFIRAISSSERLLDTLGKDNANGQELVKLIEILSGEGIQNVVFVPTLMRGFDYYTGIVFEMFDVDPKNNRALFGGGRYDDLLDIFGAKKVPAVGFGWGDVTNRDFLEVHGLLPKYTPTAKIYVCTIDNKFQSEAVYLAKKLRDKGLNVAVDLSNKKIGDQMKSANKQGVPFVVCVGENEIKSGLYPLKNMQTGDEKKVRLEEIEKLVK